MKISQNFAENLPLPFQSSKRVGRPACFHPYQHKLKNLKIWKKFKKIKNAYLLVLVSTFIYASRRMMKQKYHDITSPRKHARIRRKVVKFNRCHSYDRLNSDFKNDVYNELNEINNNKYFKGIILKEHNQRCRSTKGKYFGECRDIPKAFLLYSFPRADYLRELYRDTLMQTAKLTLDQVFGYLSNKVKIKKERQRRKVMRKKWKNMKKLANKWKKQTTLGVRISSKFKGGAFGSRDSTTFGTKVFGDLGAAKGKAGRLGTVPVRRGYKKRSTLMSPVRGKGGGLAVRVTQALPVSQNRLDVIPGKSSKTSFLKIQEMPRIDRHFKSTKNIPRIRARSRPSKSIQHLEKESVVRKIKNSKKRETTLMAPKLAVVAENESQSQDKEAKPTLKNPPGRFLSPKRLKTQLNFDIPEKREDEAESSVKGYGESVEGEGDNEEEDDSERRERRTEKYRTVISGLKMDQQFFDIQFNSVALLKKAKFEQKMKETGAAGNVTSNTSLANLDGPGEGGGLQASPPRFRSHTNVRRTRKMGSRKRSRISNYSGLGLKKRRAGSPLKISSTNQPPSLEEFSSNPTNSQKAKKRGVGSRDLSSGTQNKFSSKWGSRSRGMPSHTTFEDFSRPKKALKPVNRRRGVFVKPSEGAGEDEPTSLAQLILSSINRTEDNEATCYVPVMSKKVIGYKDKNRDDLKEDMGEDAGSGAGGSQTGTGKGGLLSVPESQMNGVVVTNGGRGAARRKSGALIFDIKEEEVDHLTEKNQSPKIPKNQISPKRRKKLKNLEKLKSVKNPKILQQAQSNVSVSGTPQPKCVNFFMKINSQKEKESPGKLDLNDVKRGSKIMLEAQKKRLRFFDSAISKNEFMEPIRAERSTSFVTTASPPNFMTRQSFYQPSEKGSPLRTKSRFQTSKSSKKTSKNMLPSLKKEEKTRVKPQRANRTTGNFKKRRVISSEKKALMSNSFYLYHRSPMSLYLDKRYKPVMQGKNSRMIKSFYMS